MIIGIIGPEDSCNAIITVMNRSFPDIEAKVYEVSQTEEAYLKVNEAERECHGIILTGIGVYSKTVEKLDISIPHIYVPFLASSIMKAIWILREEYPECTDISIDVVGKEDLEDVLDEFNLDGKINVHLFEYNHLYTEQQYVDFHIEKHKKNKKCVSIIALGWVYDEIKEMGYDVIRMYPTKSTIKATIKELISKINEDMAKDSNLAIQVIYIGEEKNISQYRKLEISSIIENKLAGYLKEVQGSMFTVSWNKYIIFSTRVAVENCQNLHVLKNTIDFFKKENISIFVGTGLGVTSRECEMNANKALESAQEYGKESIFKVENGKIEGPMCSSKSLEVRFIINSDMNKIAEKSGVNIVHLERLSSIKNKYGIKRFTSESLAEYLDVSVRTANRIINNLTESNYAVEVGKEVNKSVGRPKKIIEINII